MPGSIHSEESIAFYQSLNAPLRCISILKDGLKLPFLNENVPFFWWKNNQSVLNHFEFLQNKVNEWVKMGYAIKVDKQPKHISPLSVAERIMLDDSVKLRLCLDASFLNNLMISESSKLPPLPLSESLIDKDDYMTTLDLANCYFHVRLNAQDHRKIAFALPKTSAPDETRYDYYIIKILVYGLKPASLVISILTKPLIDHLLNKKVKATIFIDDIRASNASEEGVKNDTKKIKETFAKAGWTFNNNKETKPNQEVYYLGFHYDSRIQRYKVHPKNKSNRKTHWKSKGNVLGHAARNSISSWEIDISRTRYFLRSKVMLRQILYLGRKSSNVKGTLGQQSQTSA